VRIGRITTVAALFAAVTAALLVRWESLLFAVAVASMTGLGLAFSSVEAYEQRTSDRKTKAGRLIAICGLYLGGMVLAAIAIGRI